VDLDFVLCEYDQGKPFAIIEYKSEAAMPVKLSHPTMRALATLADESKHPFLLVIYARDYTWYRVHPVNWYATEKLGQKPLELSEEKYIELLYQLRGRRLTGSLF
jgi:Holliday junction resolvase